MDNFSVILPQEIRNRVLSGSKVNLNERKNLCERFVEKFLKLNAEDSENFNQYVIYMNKKSDKKVTKPTPPKRLTYRQRRELGLYTIGKKSLVYKDILPLHKLWEEYMTQYMDVANLKKQNWSNSHEDPCFDEVSLKLFRADYHGCELTVIQSTCPSFVGKSGIVVIETKNCFKLLGRDNVVRTIPKASTVFKFKLDEFEFTFFGKNLQIRPAERSAKKVKTVYISDL